MLFKGTITTPQGFSAAGVSCGIKESGALDLGLLVCDQVCPASAVFTRNRFVGAPIVVGREHIHGGRLRAIVVNSGISNVATGEAGIRDARKMCDLVAAGLECDPSEVLPSSTGIIGESLPMEKIEAGIHTAIDELSPSLAAGRRFAKAILTTDTRAKHACEKIRVGKEVITIAGVAKGSGMIAPNMATMLAYITTDAKLNATELKRLLNADVDLTFNRITVDGCASTSDTVVMMASGASAAVESKAALVAFASAVHKVFDSLAYQIVADGEGATKVIDVIVTNAKNTKEAHAAARAIANSPLVKTAIHGEDPNWGRIVQALGATEVTFEPDDVSIRLDRTTIFSKGTASSRVEDDKLVKIMKQKHIPITIDLGAGKASDRVLTCDLSREYVSINSDYHT